MARIEDHMAKDPDGRPVMKRGKVPTPKAVMGKGRTPTGREAASASQSIKETGAHKLIAKAKGHAPKPF